MPARLHGFFLVREPILEAFKSCAQERTLSIRVDGYEIRADASISYQVLQPQYAGEIDDDDPLFQHVTHLTIVGTSTYSEERANARYEVTIYGDDAPSRGVHAKLKDAQVRGEYGSPEYREYRGR